MVRNEWLTVTDEQVEEAAFKLFGVTADRLQHMPRLYDTMVRYVEGRMVYVPGFGVFKKERSSGS